MKENLPHPVDLMLTVNINYGIEEFSSPVFAATRLSRADL